MVRHSKKLPTKEIILIYCEGRSEEAYFKMLNRKYHGANVKTEKIDITSLGRTGMTLLKSAVAKRSNLPRNKKFDRCYVILDRDAMNDSDVHQCYQYAKANNITIILSSTNFEVWVLLHFEYFSRDYSTKELVQRLSGEKYFNQSYSRFKGQRYDKYPFDMVESAISNGSKLYQEHNDCVHSKPFTNVFRYIPEIYDVEQF